MAQFSATSSNPAAGLVVGCSVVKIYLMLPCQLIHIDVALCQMGPYSCISTTDIRHKTLESGVTDNGPNSAVIGRRDV